MATDTSSPRRFTWTGMGFGLLFAAAVGVGIPYAYDKYVPEKADAASAAVPAPAPAEPPPPPKITFLGMAKMVGNEAKLPGGENPKVTAELLPDDAAIVWLKMEAAPSRQAGGSASPSITTMAPASTGAPAGGRGGRPPVNIRDSSGRDYSFGVERMEDGLVALHVKKGYAKKPPYLTISQSAGEHTIASWKITGLPEPKVVLPDGALQGKPLGEILLRPGRGGRIGATAHLTMPLPKNQGVILRPVATTYTVVDAKANPQPGVSRPGESPFDARISIPNARMARRVSFDMMTYEAAQTVEEVTFKSARIESRFGQPTLIVQDRETVESPSGYLLALVQQSLGPRRAPKRLYPEIDVRLLVSLEKLKLGPDGIVPGLVVEVVQPTPQAFGLAKINLIMTPGSMPQGTVVFTTSVKEAKPVPAGTFKFGPTPLTVRLTITRPKVVSTRRIVLPVNPKLLPADPNAGGGGAMPGTALMAPVPNMRLGK